MLKKITIILFLIAISGLLSAADKAERGFFMDTRRIMEGWPVVGEIVKDAQREEKDRFHTHESGVYYENVTHDMFMSINYRINKGSLKKNLSILAEKYGWKLMWNIGSDYEIPVGFTIKNKKLPEIFAETIFHLPIKTVFYSKNKVIMVLPMYDKRETDVGTKYSINPRA